MWSRRTTATESLIDNVHDIVDRFYVQDIVDKRSLTID